MKKLKEAMQNAQEAMDATVAKIAAVAKDHKFMDLRKPLMDAGFKKIDFNYSPIPHYRVKTSGKDVVIASKKYTSGGDAVVGDIAIGYEGK